MSRGLAKVFLILLNAFFVFGCSLHQSQTTETLIEIPPSYSSGAQVPSPPIGRWWEQFEDENLNALMEETFRNNLDIVQTYERLRQSEEVFRKTGAARGLFVDVTGSGTRSRQSGFFRGSSNAGGLGATTFNSYSLSAAARYELDLWGKLKSNADAARHDISAAAQDLKALFVSISARLADLYFLASEQRAQLDLSDQTVASFKDTLERVERRYRGGLVHAIDVYQSRQNLASAKA